MGSTRSAHKFLFGLVEFCVPHACILFYFILMRVPFLFVFFQVMLCSKLGIWNGTSFALEERSMRVEGG